MQALPDGRVRRTESEWPSGRGKVRVERPLGGRLPPQGKGLPQELPDVARTTDGRRDFAAGSDNAQAAAEPERVRRVAGAERVDPAPSRAAADRSCPARLPAAKTWPSPFERGSVPSRSKSSRAKAWCLGSWSRGEGPAFSLKAPRRGEAGSSVSTPKGLSVSSRVRAIHWRRRIEPHAAAPRTPSPPALDTAAASSGVAAPPIPASTTGTSIFSRSQILVRGAIRDSLSVVVGVYGLYRRFLRFTMVEPNRNRSDGTLGDGSSARPPRSQLSRCRDIPLWRGGGRTPIEFEGSCRDRGSG